MKTDSRSFIAPDRAMLNPMDSSLLDRVEHKDDFSQKRFRCITNPERALDTLSPYGVLELGIMSGRDLVERETGILKSYDTTADAFVEVLLDDLKLDKFQTPIARGMEDPIWKYSCKVEIVAPQSMLRLQVVDDRATEKAKIGFVEICLADIPFGTEIEGWFELRFQDNLKRTSPIRYDKHCEEREEQITARATQEAEVIEQNKKDVAAGESTDQVVATKNDVFAKEKTRSMDVFQTFLHASAEKAQQLGFETLSASMKEGTGGKTRINAGELYLHLKLTRVVGWSDGMFALALTPPRPHDSGFDVHPSVDIQYCADEIWEFKVKLIEDALYCIMYWLKYMISWRSSFLSFLYLLGFTTACWHSYTMWAIAPFLAALSLVINSFESVRMFMTRGGRNSPFTDDGLTWTAAWRSPDEMFMFVLRLVQDDMKMIVQDGEHQHKLRLFAARCFRDGVPLVTIEELRAALKLSKIINKPEEAKDAAPSLRLLPTTTQGNDVLASGDLVWVDGRDKAKIVQSGPAENQITVLYEANPRNKGRAVQHVVERRRVKPRAVKLPVPHWMIQGFAVEAVKAIFPFIHDFKEVALPRVQVITDVLIWENFRAALGLTIALLITSAAFSAAAVLHILGEVTVDGSLNNTAEVLILLLRKADNTILTIVVFVVLVAQAWWFAGARSLMRIMSRMCHSRSAPAKWAFFKEDKAHKSLLAGLAQKESTAGLSQFNSTTSFKDARVTYAGSNV